MRKSTLGYLLIFLASIVLFVFYNNDGRLTDRIFSGITYAFSGPEVAVKISNYRKPVVRNFTSHMKENERRVQNAFNKISIGKSLWNQTEKKFFTELLARNSYDVLVVPFQNNSSAIDSAGRFLMTLYMSDTVSKTGLRTPDPEQVLLALGESSRKYERKEVLGLAAKLNVKTIIWCYVGHEGRKVSFKIKAEEISTGISRLEEFNAKYNDIALPSVIFNSKVETLVENLLDARINNANLVQKKPLPVKMPLAPAYMVKNAKESPLLSAYYLQTLGALSIPSAHRDRLFARSLLATSYIGTNRDDINLSLLKARAYFYLNRRPKALDILKNKPSNEDRALLAMLNGDLVKLEKYSKKINNEVDRYISMIELENLRYAYKDKVDETVVSEFSMRHLMYSFLMKRQFSHQDPWSVQSNIELKKVMDREFPLEGESLENLFSRQAVLVDLDMENELDLSIEAHFKKYIKRKGDKVCCRKYMWNPGNIDLLFIYRNVGESNLIKKIHRKINLQGLPKKGLDLISKFESVYEGHSGIMAEKVAALYGMARNVKQEHKTRILQRAYQLATNVYFWSGGQNNISSQVLYYIKAYLDNNGSVENAEISAQNKGLYSKIRSVYFEDFPLMWDWSGLNAPLSYKPADRKIYLERSYSQLAYTSTGFSIFKYLHTRMLKGNRKGADELFSQNKHRFNGHSRRALYIATTVMDSANIDKTIKYLENAINNEKNNWKLYWRLGRIYVSESLYGKAERLFSKYSLFQNTNNRDPVLSSNIAENVADLFYWRGKFDIAKQFYELSASYHTGSAAGYESRVKLSQLKGDYSDAARASLQYGNRYHSISAYGGYMRYLHILGYDEPARNAFTALQEKENGRVLWEAAEVGIKKQGKSYDETVKWIQETLRTKNIDAGTRRLLAQFAFRVLTIDRKPNPDMIKVLTELCQLKHGYACYGVMMKKDEKMTSQQKHNRFVPSLTLLKFASGYNHLRNENYSQALDDFHLSEISLTTSNYFLPYLTWAAVKAKKQDIVTPYLDKIKKDIASNLNLYERYRFDYELSNAFILAGNGDHDMAISQLKTAFNNRVISNTRPFFTWYQLVEACEWLFEDTKDERYKKLAIEWARKYQIARPDLSWAYAVEARYTDDPKKRIRALALTLYLDKNSQRISHFTEDQKNKALEWLDNNNPFLEENVKKHNPSLI